jgi:hypothetical protein|tara:strand:+ start:1152 stop:1595 length:444 start_codon:yes stop_codon:yes gene_type:complete
MTRIEILIETLDDLSWEVYPDIVESLMRFDRNQLTDELERQGPIYSYYYGLMCVAKKKLDESNQFMTAAAANARKEAKFDTKVKLTAKDLDDIAFTDPIYEDTLEKVRTYSEKYGLLKGIVASLEQKKDMLIQLSSNARAEANLYRN